MLRALPLACSGWIRPNLPRTSCNFPTSSAPRCGTSTPAPTRIRFANENTAAPSSRRGKRSDRVKRPLHAARAWGGRTSLSVKSSQVCSLGNHETPCIAMSAIALTRDNRLGTRALQRCALPRARLKRYLAASRFTHRRSTASATTKILSTAMSAIALTRGTTKQRQAMLASACAPPIVSRDRGRQER